MKIVNNLPKKINGYLREDGDSTNLTTSFTSNDTESATEWTALAPLSSGEKHASIFNKASTMFKNMRYLYKMLGTTDISAIGDGTVTGAIGSLNETFKNKYDILNTALTDSLTHKDLIGSGFNCTFNSEGYKFIEVTALIGNYCYSKTLSVFDLKNNGTRHEIINMRYNADNYYSGVYAISCSGILGIVSSELVGAMNIVNSLYIYGIK